ATASRGSSYAADATGQLEKLRRRLSDERSAMESKTQEAIAKEDFRAALAVWDSDARRYDVPEWTRAAAARVDEIKAETERRVAVALETASDLKRRGDEAGAKSVRAKVASWGVPGDAEKIDRALV